MAFCLASGSTSRGDPIVPAAVSTECSDQFGAQYAEISSPAHLVVIDQEEEFYAIVEEVVALTLRSVSIIITLWEGKNVKDLLGTGGDGSRAGCWQREALSC